MDEDERGDVAAAFWGDEYCVTVLALSDEYVEPGDDLELNIDVFVPDASGMPMLMGSTGSSWMGLTPDCRDQLAATEIWWSGFATRSLMHDGRSYAFGCGIAGAGVDRVLFHGKGLDGYVTPSPMGGFLVGGRSTTTIFAGPADPRAPFGIDRQYWLDFGDRPPPISEQ